MYIDVHYDKEKNKVFVSERKNRKRIVKTYNPILEFYYEDDNGVYNTLFGTKAKKKEFKDIKKFYFELKKTRQSGIRTFESDISVENKILEKYYRNSELPELNIGFFDIEVEFDLENGGFAVPEKPTNRISTISIYTTYEKRNMTFTLYPKTMNRKQAEKELEGLEDVHIFDDEENLLDEFLEYVQNVDVLTGWNSKKYDIPYIVERMKIILGESEIKRLCLENFPPPKKRIFTQFNKEFLTYELSGRHHIDYLELYMKHSSSEVPSYKLDFIGEKEIGEKKVAYKGTLDDLYKNDFRKFIEYSKQDVMILYKIDQKKKYLELSNIVSHLNCVTLPTTLGSISLIEQALTLKSHDLKMVCPDKDFIHHWEKVNFTNQINSNNNENEDENESENEDKDESVAGAFVIYPKKGLHDFVGSVDINSLYPSIIRSLNMSPEKIFAQVLPTYTNNFILNKIKEGCKTASEAMHDLFGILEYNMIMLQTDDILQLEMNDTKEIYELKAKEIYEMIFGGKDLSLSANGTIFIMDKKGLVPILLEEWFTNRKKLQKLAKIFSKLSEDGFELPEEILEKMKQ